MLGWQAERMLEFLGTLVSLIAVDVWTNFNCLSLENLEMFS